MPRPPKILIVDDDADNRMYLGDALTSKDYVTVTADSGPMALQTIQEEQPDLVLLDVMMPGMTGYEVCQRLREDPVTTLLPVVLVTGVSPAERVKGIEAGADDFLTKPINPRFNATDPSRHGVTRMVKQLIPPCGIGKV